MSDVDERPRLEINWVQSAGGALAAVSSAVLLSTFGVAGTLIGAAVGSLVITVGGAIYSYSIRATRQRVAMAQTVAAARIGFAQARVREASEEVAQGTPRAADAAAEDLAAAEVDLDRAQAVLVDEPAEADQKLDWRGVLGGLPWKRIAAGATAIFVAAMLVILAFELFTGRAVSSYTGGSDPDRRTSIPGIGGDVAPEEPGEPQPGAPATEEDVLPPEDEPDEAEPTGPASPEPVATDPTTGPMGVPTTQTSPPPEPTEEPTTQTPPAP